MKKKATIYDIAKFAGVSSATVSRTIHQPDIVTERTRNKILKAFDHYEMSPEDLSVKTKRSGASGKNSFLQNTNILVCIPDWDNPFYDDLLIGIQHYLNQMHYHMLVSMEIPNKYNMASFLNYCASLHIAGILMMYPLSEDILRQITATYPMVQCCEYNPLYQKVPYVSVDDYAISKAVIAYLIQEGCKKIGFFSSPYDYRYVQNSFRAYKTTLTSNNLKINPEYVVQVADFSYDRILMAANHFFRLPDPPDAVFATSDKHAHAVIKAALNAGFRIPQDMKVFGFDNTMYAELSTPTISTVAQPRREIGIQGAKMLLEQIKNRHAPVKSLLLPAKLLIQEST